MYYNFDIIVIIRNFALVNETEVYEWCRYQGIVYDFGESKRDRFPP